MAGQSKRLTQKELIKKIPADGLVAGLGSINKNFFGKEKSKCCIMSYDYMVLAGTQGGFNHKKTDRLISIAKKGNLPIVFFVEGGGGRPGDIDFDSINSGGLDLSTWSEFAKLSGKVPRIAVVSGNCFAGNAAIAGCADGISAVIQGSVIQETSSQLLELPAGWSLFSSFLTLDEMSIDSVLNPIFERLIIVKDYQGLAYLPEWSFNGIGEMIYGDAYLIKISENSVLELNGLYNLPEENPITIRAGWSLIGYLRH